MRGLTDATDAVADKHGEVDVSVTLRTDDGRKLASYGERVLVDRFGLGVESENLVADELGNVDDAFAVYIAAERQSCGRRDVVSCEGLGGEREELERIAGRLRDVNAIPCGVQVVEVEEIARRVLLRRLEDFDLLGGGIDAN